MTRIKPNQKIQRPRTEEEMRGAIADIRTKSAVVSKISQDDDTDIILLDCIEELLEARSTITKIRNFVHAWMNDLSLPI